MPYPNEHACRKNDPGKYDKMRRKNSAMFSKGRPIHVIYGIKDGKSEIQAMRYPKKSWTSQQAKSHCKSHGGKKFEPASGVAKRYTNIKKLPDDVKKLPVNARLAWMLKYNAHYSINKNDEESYNTAWEAVKKYYEEVDGIWKPKKSYTLEHFLKEGNRMESKKKVTIHKHNGKEGKGKFNFFFPLERDADGFIKVVKDSKTGQNSIRGIATHTGVDREDERATLEFIEKNRPDMEGMNVFFDHDRKLDSTAGFIKESFGEDGVLGIEVSLEDPSWNANVEKFLKKKEHGTNFGFSIGGRVTSASKKYDSDSGKYINEFADGIITEVSITPAPAQYATDVSIVKCWNESFSKAVDDLEYDEEVEYVELTDDEKLDAFWEDYEKATPDKDEINWDDIDIDELPKECFLKADGLDRGKWKYPVRYYVEVEGDVNKELKFHTDRLNAAWAYANGATDGVIASKQIRKTLREARKSLELQSRTLYYEDIEKVVVSSLVGAIEAQDARDKLSKITEEFDYAIRDVVWRTDLKKKDKISAIKNLAGQLAAAVNELSDKLAYGTYVQVKELSLNAEEVNAMKKAKKKVDEIKTDDLQEKIEKTFEDKITDIVEDVFVKALNPDEEKVKEEKTEKKVEKKEEPKEEEKVEKKEESKEEEKVEKKESEFVTKDDLDKFKDSIISAISSMKPEPVEKSIKDKTTDDEVTENELDKAVEKAMSKVLNSAGVRLVGVKKSQVLDKSTPGEEKEVDSKKELNKHFGKLLGIRDSQGNSTLDEESDDDDEE